MRGTGPFTSLLVDAYAMLQAERNPTRTSLVSAVDDLQNDDAGGAVGPHTPSDHGAYICTVGVVVKGNDFVRKAPASGRFCDGQLAPASP